MSRIHDALKKAEEQRLGSLGSNPELVPVSPGLTMLRSDSEVAANPSSQTSGYPPVAPVTDAVAFGSHLLDECVHTTWTPSKDAIFLNNNEDQCPGMEEFRRLRSKLFQMRGSRKLKTLLISSAMPSEGKSFVAANVAQAFARQRGGRTLLIDADLRKPHMHEVLGAPFSPGLREYLSGKASEKDVIQRSSHDDLFFIPAGHGTSTASELIGNGKLKLLLDTVSPLFSWIVIDSSPVIPVTDATRLGELVDGVLLVVRAASTPSFLAERAKKEFQNAPILGVVFNYVAQKENPYYKYSQYSYPTQKQD